MARDTAYISPQEFAQIAGGGGSGNIPSGLIEQIASADRMLDYSLGYAPGMFNTHSGIYDFDSVGGARLYLRDGLDRVYPFTAITSIGIDTENDLTYDGYSWTLADAWVRPMPENNDDLGLPWEALDIFAFVSGAPLATWPVRRAAVRVTGTFGHATVPERVKQLVAHTVHDLRDAHVAGGSGTPPTYDGIQMSLTPQTWRVWLSVKAEFNRRVPPV